MDMSDLYDWEVVAIAHKWRELMDEFSRKTNTRHNLELLANRAAETFQKIGLVVEVNTMPCLIFNPYTQRSGSPEIVVVGRIPGTEDSEGFDHERKRWEVLASRARGEDYFGIKDGKPIK